MPRSGPRRKPLAVKISDAARDAITTRAKTRQLLKGNGEPNLSEMARIMLAYAERNMPANWTPSTRYRGGQDA